MAGQGKVGNLVVLITHGAGHIHQYTELAGSLSCIDRNCFVVRNGMMQCRTLLNSECIGREMRYLQLTHLIQILLPMIVGHTGHTIYKVNTQLIESHVLRPLYGGLGLLRALVDTGAASVMLLPNGFVAAEELVAGCTAAIGWGIDVVPLPTRSMVQGLAALAVHDAGRPAVDDGYTMAAAAGATRIGSVRMAAEDALTWAGPCHTGDGLGIFGGEVLVVRHDVTAAARGLIDLMLGVGGELVTVLLGAGLGASAPDVAAALIEHVHRHHLGTELVTYDTGHDGDALFIGVE